MNAAADLVRDAAAAGLALVPDGEALRVRGPAEALERFTPALREHKAVVMALLADPATPCSICGCGSFWNDGTAWCCESCTQLAGDAERWLQVSGGTLAPMPAPAVAWPDDLTADLRRVSVHFEWTRQDIADFCRWARRSPQALGDASHFLAAEVAKLPRCTP